MHMHKETPFKNIGCHGKNETAATSPFLKTLLLSHRPSQTAICKKLNFTRKFGSEILTVSGNCILRLTVWNEKRKRMRHCMIIYQYMYWSLKAMQRSISKWNDHFPHCQWHRLSKAITHFACVLHRTLKGTASTR